jgi:hypothetical protein
MQGVLQIDPYLLFPYSTMQSTGFTDAKDIMMQSASAGPFLLQLRVLKTK